jgi:hypothetical protein
MTTFVDRRFGDHKRTATISTLGTRMARSIAGTREIIRTRRHASRMTQLALDAQRTPHLPSIVFFGLG